MITSTSNPRIKHLIRLRKRRDRDAEGVTLVEGLTELRRAAAADVPIRSIYYNPDVADASRFPEAFEVHTVSAEALGRTTMRDSTEGFVAIVECLTPSLGELSLGPAPLLLVVEAVEKPGNLGAMLRTADAAGVDAVVMADPATDIWNPNVVRASLGCVFTVPIAVATTPEVTAWLRADGIALCATSPDAEQTLYDADLTGRVAIAVGAEHAGLSPVFMGEADIPIRIPMAGAADSLNASVAAAVALYEAVRQRSLRSS